MRCKAIKKLVALIAMCLGVIIFSGCARTNILIRRIEPPKYPIKGGKVLAVINFKAPASDPSAGEKVAGAFVSKLAPSRYYELMERSRMDSIMAERRLAQTDMVDPGKAIELGKILNAQYIISGEVNAYDVQDERMTEQEERTRIAGYYVDRRGLRTARYETYFVDVPVMVRSATVSASFRMVNVETSEIIVAESRTASYKKRAKGSGEIGSLPPRDEILNRLTDEVTGYFAALIAPHPVEEEKVLEKGKTAECKRGVKLAQSGLWDEAVSSWERGLDLRPDDPAPYNNLGVAAEVQGDYDKAIDYYTKALKVKPNDRLYMDNLHDAQRLKRIYSREYKE